MKVFLFLIFRVSVTTYKQTNNMQTQAQTQSQDVLQQFSEMLKNHSIIVNDRENLVKLFENIIELCTNIPKPKLKAAVKAATKESKTKSKKTVSVAVAEKLVGPTDAGDCPMASDLVKPAARGRGRPRKDASSDGVAVTTATPAGDAEKKKRGRPKKDKSVMISSNEDEDALIAKMISDVKLMKKNEESNEIELASDAESELEQFTGSLMRAEETTPVAIADPDEEDADKNSVSPVHTTIAFETPMPVEKDVPAVKAKGSKVKAAKELAVKEPKAKPAKETKVKDVKEPKVKPAKEPKPVKSTKESKPEPELKAEKIASEVEAIKESYDTPYQENQMVNGKIYLMAMIPTEPLTCKGKPYLRTETGNVYDKDTYELVGVWDCKNKQIITAVDNEEDSEVEDLLFSDEE